MLHRKQIEIHLCRVGLILAYSIKEDRDTRRQAHHRPRVEASGAQIELEGSAQIIVK
jgi:hypothetical protein